MRHRTLLVIIFVAMFIGQEARAQSILTVAGGWSNDGRLATEAVLGGDLAIDASGNLYLTSGGRFMIHRVDAVSGLVSAIAGNGGRGVGGDGGPATLAALNLPKGAAVDSAGNFFFAEEVTGCVRRVDAASGIITTVAGNGVAGFSGDGGPATEASFGRLQHVAVDLVGNLYISDGWNHRVRRVDVLTGLVTTFAGNGMSGSGGDGGLAIHASLEPADLAIDSSGNLYVADGVNHRVRRVDAITGVITTVAGNGTKGDGGDGGLATDASLDTPYSVAVQSFVELESEPVHDIFLTDGFGSRIRRVDGVSGIISTVAQIESIGTDLAVGPGGKLHYSGPFKNSSGARVWGVFRVDAETGARTLIAGGVSGVEDDVPAAGSLLASPMDLAIGPDDDIFIADYWHHVVRRVEFQTGIISTAAGTGVADLAPESIYLPAGVAADADGSLYVTEPYLNRVRRVDGATGAISTFAGSGSPGFDGDGGPATEALLRQPGDVAIDGSGNLYIADEGNLRVRRVDSITGTITTVAGSGSAGFTGDGGPATEATLGSRYVLAIGPQQHLYVADEFNHRVRRVDAVSGRIETVAGGGDQSSDGEGVPATLAELKWPDGVVLDESGNIFIADQHHFTVRRVDASTHRITTVAGDGSFTGNRGEGGPATEASMSFPGSVAVDSNGNLYIADNGANRVRAVFACVEIDGAELQSPPDGASDLDHTTTLSWSAVSGAFTYDVLLDEVFPPGKKSVSGIATTSYTPPHLDSNTTYYWQVVANGDPYCEPQSVAESGIRSFSTHRSRVRPIRRP